MLRPACVCEPGHGAKPPEPGPQRAALNRANRSLAASYNATRLQRLNEWVTDNPMPASALDRMAWRDARAAYMAPLRHAFRQQYLANLRLQGEGRADAAGVFTEEA